MWSLDSLPENSSVGEEVHILKILFPGHHMRPMELECAGERSPHASSSFFKLKIFLRSH